MVRYIVVCLLVLMASICAVPNIPMFPLSQPSTAKNHEHLLARFVQVTSLMQLHDNAIIAIEPLEGGFWQVGGDGIITPNGGCTRPAASPEVLLTGKVPKNCWLRVSVLHIQMHEPPTYVLWGRYKQGSVLNPLLVNDHGSVVLGTSVQFFSQFLITRYATSMFTWALTCIDRPLWSQLVTIFVRQ